MRRNVGLILAVGCLIAAMSCGTDDPASDGARCDNEQARCDGMLLQRCERGQWRSYDCAAHCASSGLSALACSDPDGNGVFTCSCGTPGVGGTAGFDGGVAGMGGTSGNGGSGGVGGTGGTDPYVACNGTPETCEDIGPDVDQQYFGCCDGSVVFWCQDEEGAWTLVSEDCSVDGLACRYVDEWDSMYCGEGGSGGAAGAAGSSGGSAGTAGSSGTGQEVACASTPIECDDIGPDEDAQYYGCCDGDTVYWCQDEGGSWTMLSDDCASQGLDCVYSAQWQSMYCEAGSAGSAGASGNGGSAGNAGASGSAGNAGGSGAAGNAGSAGAD